MKNISYFYFAATLLLFASACRIEENINLPLCALSKSNSTNIENSELLNREDETISLKMALHSKRLLLKSSDFEKAHLSEEHIKEIQSWWQSLPQIVQTQVKNNEVSVEVISNIVTKNNSLSAQTTDKQIEQTGNALEQVIGTRTEMTYTVNTTVVEKIATTTSLDMPPTKSKDTIAKTDIVLMQNIDVKLSKFELDLVAFTATKNDNEIFQTLQYWWTNLPIDLQDKIRNNEVSIDFQLKPVSNIEYTKGEVLPSSISIFEKLDMYADVLNRFIGTSKNKYQQTAPLVSINKDKTLPKNVMHYTLHLHLRNNNKQASLQNTLQPL